MSELERKLQIEDRPIRVLNAPDGFPLRASSAGDAEYAVLVFVRSRAELEELGGPAVEAARTDGLSWVAYPKGGQLGTDLNRDTLGEAMKGRGVRPVRQIAIDEVWSALRFRPAEGGR